MLGTRTKPATTSEEFDKVYKSVTSYWEDHRFPKELEQLVAETKPKTSLDLGCGLGMASSFMAEKGVATVGIDFSPVAIDKAKRRISKERYKPIFLVGDVTDLNMLDPTFDVTYDLGCFQCLQAAAQEKYIEEVYRLLKPGGTHLIWATDSTPSQMQLSPNYIAQKFESKFELTHSKESRRKLKASHWYWLKRTA